MATLKHVVTCPKCHHVATTLVTVDCLHYKVCPKCATRLKRYSDFVHPGKIEVR